MELIRISITLVWILVSTLVAHLAAVFPQRGRRAAHVVASRDVHPSDYRPRHLSGAGRRHA